MTALVLHGRTLDLHRNSGFGLARGLLRSAMGPLQHNRLKDVLAQAEQAGIKGSIPEILRDPRLVDVLSRHFKVPVPNLDACRRYYREYVESFRRADRYLGRQIVLRCPRADRASRAEAWARAERLIAILFFDPKMFADLIATYDSISDESGSGRLGPVERGELPLELDIALCGLRPGQIYPAPVATDQGIHVMVLDRIIPGEVTPFAVVHGRICAALRKEMRTAAARRHLQRLAERYSIAAE